MKKLLILSAMAMSAGAIFANPLAAEDFESLTAGAVLTGDTATAFGDNWGTGVGSGSEVEATVTAYGAEGAIATPAESRPSAFEGATPNANYLAISTSTAPLYYYHDTNKGQASVADNAIYFDSVVQFTPTELTWDKVGDATQAGMETGDKIAVWLANIEASNDNNKAAATKLMITAGLNTSGDTITPTNFMANCTVTAGTWYRLTIKATGDGKYDGGTKTTANFKVYVDGTEVSAGVVASDGTVETPATSFLSAVSGDQEGATEISNVGFKGTGAVDDLVWTRDDPFAVEGAEFAIDTKQYATFAAALAEAESGATITMIANSETAIEVTDGKNVTLDLNGCTLSAGISNAGTLEIVNNHAENAAIVTGNVTNSGTLTIQEAFIAFMGSVAATTINGGYYATTKPTGAIPSGYGWVTITGNELFEDGSDTLYYYLDVSEEPGEDPVIDPAAETISVEVAAESANAAITAVKEAIVVPSGASESVTQAAYAEYFNYKATASATEGYFTVEIESIKEDNIAQVENAALEALQGDGTVTVLPGLYYGFAAGAAPTGLTVSTLDLATGTTMDIVKPESTDKGFLKVVVSPKPTLDSAK